MSTFLAITIAGTRNVHAKNSYVIAFKISQGDLNVNIIKYGKLTSGGSRTRSLSNNFFNNVTALLDVSLERWTTSKNW